MAMTSSTPMPLSEDWYAAAIPWKLVRMVGRQRFARQLLHAVDGVAERNAGQQVEGDGDRRQLAQMRHRRAAPISVCMLATESSATNFPLLERDVEQGQAIGIELVLRQQLHDHVVGVGGACRWWTISRAP